MDSNSADKVPNSFHHHHEYDGGRRLHHHHHHHFFYIASHCPLHRPILQPKNHSPSCSFSNYCAAPQNPEPLASHPNQTLHNSLMTQDEIEKVENEEEEEEEEEEAIFVLTDEWKEFFARSEAKRRLAKKQAKKGKN